MQALYFQHADLCCCFVTWKNFWFACTSLFLIIFHNPLSIAEMDFNLVWQNVAWSHSLKQILRYKHQWQNLLRPLLRTKEPHSLEKKPRCEWANCYHIFKKDPAEFIFSYLCWVSVHNTMPAFWQVEECGSSALFTLLRAECRILWFN